MKTKKRSNPRYGLYFVILLAGLLLVGFPLKLAPLGCTSAMDTGKGSSNEEGNQLTETSWCHDTYAPEGSIWYSIHRDRCISDYVPQDTPRCIKEIATGLETVRFMTGVTVGRNGERIFGNSWADYEGEPNVFGAVVQGNRVEELWSDTVGQSVAFGTPTIASMWRISRVELLDLAQGYGEADLLDALRSSSAAWTYMTEDEVAVDGLLYALPGWLKLTDSRVQAGEIVMTLEAPYPSDSTTMRSTSGEVSAIGYWGPGSEGGSLERIWQTRDEDRLQSVAGSGGNLTSDGNWVVQTVSGDLVIFHRLTGEILGYLSFSSEINKAFGYTGSAALTPDTTLNLNSVAVGRNPQTGIDHLYAALTQGRFQKLPGPGGVNFELGEATAGFFACALWDPKTKSLTFYWADRLDMELSEASPTIHPFHGAIYSAFGKYVGVEDSPVAEAPTNLYAWSPDGIRLAELPLAGRTVASPAIIPANPEKGFKYDYLVIGAGMGKLNMPQVFRFDPSDGSLTPVYNPTPLKDPILTTNLYVNQEGLMFMGTIFPGVHELLKGPFYFAVFDIKEILQEKQGAEIKLVDRVEVRSLSCNNVAYDATNRRYIYSMVCSPDIRNLHNPSDPGASYGIHVLGEDLSDDPADGCEMEVKPRFGFLSQG